jgi:DNA-binding SARP family transcriptional activator
MVRGPVDPRKAAELLEAGRYEHLARLLDEAQAANRSADWPVLADILAAARRICLACGKCRSEVGWHRQASAEADERERELRRELQTILELIGGYGRGKDLQVREDSPDTPTLRAVPAQTRDARSSERQNLWQRLQVFLRRRSRQRPPGRAPPTHSPPASPRTSTAPEPHEVTSPVQRPPSLVFYLLGPLRVYQNDHLIAEWSSLKGLSILKYMAAHRDRPVARDVLMDLFWSDADPDAARRNLHQAIYSLRETLRRGHLDFQHIRFEDGRYSLSPDMNIWIDSEEFEAHVRIGQRLEASGRFAEAAGEYGVAEALYQGDFLEEEPYEDWPSLPRAHFRNLYLNIGDRLSDYYIQHGEFAAAVALCRKVLAQDSCYEEAHRGLMRCYIAQGQRHLAVRQYQTCVQALKGELDLAPSEETLALYRHITSG